MSGGIGLIEAVAGISIVSIFIFSLMLATQLSQKIVGESVRNIQASFLLEEGVDAVKIFRDTSWSSGIGNLVAGQNYFFSYNGTTWISTKGDTGVSVLEEFGSVKTSRLKSTTRLVSK